MEQPRLIPKSRDEIIREKLELFYLPERSFYQIQNLLDGKAQERALVCCNSGCEVCNETIANCLQAVRAELESKLKD